MSDQINNGGPAFPFDWKDFQPETGAQVTREQFPGMSLRDWLAGCETLRDWDNPDVSMTKQMAAALAGCDAPEKGWSDDPITNCEFEAKWRARLRVIRADALIAALNKPR